jgi:hypothetical protein
LTNWEATMMVLMNLVPARRQNWVEAKADLKQNAYEYLHRLEN